MTNQLEVRFTIAMSESDIGKQFSAPDGKTIVKKVLGQLYSGVAKTHVLRGDSAHAILSTFGRRFLTRIQINHALMLGTAVNGLVENRLCVKDDSRSVAEGALGRTKENFGYQDELSLLLADNDDGRGTRAILIGLHKPLADVAMLTMPSSSSAVLLNCKPYKDGGEHCYMVVRHGGRHKEVLLRLLHLAALRGLAHIKIATNGRLLLRGPVDAAVYGAERLVFPGMNHVKPPVTQGPREPTLWEGGVLDAGQFLAETEDHDRDRLREIIDEMRDEKQAEADLQAEAWGRDRVKKAVAHGGPRVRTRAEKQTRKMVEKTKRANRKGPGIEGREHETLEADFVLDMADGSQVTVREVVANPEKYDGLRCADPFEGPGYGSVTTATILVNRATGRPWIYSHAHGGTTDFSLDVRELIGPDHEYAMMDITALLAEAGSLGQCPKPGAADYAGEAEKRGRDADLLIRAAVEKDADEIAEATLKAALVHATPMGKRQLNTMWKAAEAEKEAYEAANAADERGEAEIAALGNLLATIGLPPDADLHEVYERHFATFAFDMEEKTVVGIDNRHYAMKPAEHHSFWLPYAEVTQAWHNDPARRVSVMGSRMRPDMTYPLYVENGATWRNLYRPPSHPAHGGDAAVFLEMMVWMLPEAAEREWFLDWLAHKLRKPAVRATAVIMVAVTKSGEQSFGTGRGMLFRFIGKLFGEDYVRPADYSELTGKGSQGVFNDFLEALIVTVNEAAEGVDDFKYHERRAAYENLKNSIDTSPAKVRIRTKYGKTRDITTFASTIIASNHGNALAIPADDRRFTVLRNGPPLQHDLRTRFAAWMDSPKNIGAAFRLLAARDLSAFNPYTALVTRAKQHMARSGLSSLDHLIAEARETMPGKAFVLPQLRGWMDANGGDDQDAVSTDAWKVKVNAAMRQHTQRLARPNGTRFRASMSGSRRRDIYTWPEHEDEMLALGARAAELLTAEVMKNNRTGDAPSAIHWNDDDLVISEKDAEAEGADNVTVVQTGPGKRLN